MLHYYDLEMSEVFVHDNFLINQIKEGIHVQPKHTDILQEILDKHFAKKPLVYIGNRVNSYTVDPITYGFVASIKNLLAMAIVSYDEKARTVAEFEREFYTKPFEIFDNLTEAIIWAYNHLSSSDSNNE